MISLFFTTLTKFKVIIYHFVAQPNRKFKYVWIWWIAKPIIFRFSQVHDLDLYMSRLIISGLSQVLSSDMCESGELLDP